MKETEWILSRLKREKFIEGAIREYGIKTNSNDADKNNSKVQIEGDIVLVHLKNEQYETIATYRVYNEKDYVKMED